MRMPATKQDNGFWRFQKVMVDPLTGEKTRLRKRGFKTKRDAEIAEATAILLYSSEPELIEELPVSIVIDDFIALKQANINARSMQKKLRMINSFIRPYLGDVDLHQFTNLDARRYYDRLLKFDTTPNHKNEILALTKSIFVHAENSFGISISQIRRLQKFKNIKRSKGLFNVYDIEEFEKFNSTFPDSNDYELTVKTFFNVLFWTGLRRGEAKGLRWDDISFKNKTIRIDEQYVDKDPFQGRLVCDVKTENSIREVLTDNLTMSMLKRLKEMRMHFDNFNDDQFVFLRENELVPLADTTIDRMNRVHSKMAGLKRIRIHDFRHSFASVNFSLGADVATISRQLGHSTISMTMDIYVTMMSKMNDERISMLNNARSQIIKNSRG